MPPLRVTRVAVGAATCAVLETGAIACWGRNDQGQLGNGTLVDSAIPVIVPLTGATDLDNGRYMTCAVANGVWCWGYGTDFTAHSMPAAVPLLDGATRVAAGEQFACALVSGQVRCWGWGEWGSLGNGASANSSVPVTVTGVTDAVAIAAAGLHACALEKSGSVQCWGFNGWGELGDGTREARATPVAVTGLSDVVDISAGWDTTCAVEADGSLWCWGRNEYGEAGDIGQYVPPMPDQNPDAVRLTPTLVPTPAVRAVSVGQADGCAIVVDGTVWCWGMVSLPADSPPIAPAPVHGISGVVQISTDGTTCAVREDGSLWCWTTNSSKPTRVKGL